jgi:peptide/nickel transport system permease protein
MLSPLARYLLKRFVDRFILLFVATVLVFVLVKVVGTIFYGDDPFIVYLRLQSLQFGEASEETQRVIKQLIRQFGLDEPLFPNQFVKYLVSLYTLNFGYSFTNRRPVWLEFSERIPNTFFLSTYAFLLIVALGLSLGWFMASRRGRRADDVAMGVSIFSYVMPGYLMTLIFLILLAYLPRVWWGLAIFPMPPYTPPRLPTVSIPFLNLSLPYPTLEYMWYLTLPAVAVAVAGFGAFAYYIRQLTMSELGQDYIVTARAKGLGDQVIMRRHVFRNVLPPFVTALTLSIPGLFGGVGIVTEILIAFDGMGYYLFRSIQAQDFPVVVGATFFYSILTTAALYFVDIAVALTDPRVRLQGR